MQAPRRISIRTTFLVTTYIAVLSFLFAEGNRIESRIFGFGALLGVLFLFGLLFVYFPLVSGQPDRSRLLLFVILILFTIGLFLILPSVQ